MCVLCAYVSHFGEHNILCLYLAMLTDERNRNSYALTSCSNHSLAHLSGKKIVVEPTAASLQL